MISPHSVSVGMLLLYGRVKSSCRESVTLWYPSIGSAQDGTHRIPDGPTVMGPVVPVQLQGCVQHPVDLGERSS